MALARACYQQSDLYLLDDVLHDTDTGGHNVTQTVFVECGSMYREDGPIALAPVGETLFVQGVAAMAASGTYGRTRIGAGITTSSDPGKGFSKRIRPSSSILPS